MEKLPSPNHRARKPEERLQYVIVHGTWMDDDMAALARLCDPVAEVSSHYMINRDGSIVQLVEEDRVAYHAGKSKWGGIDGLNGWSLGIEIGNNGHEPYRDGQYDALIELLADIMQRHPQIKPVHVLGHEEIAPGRKADPGPLFEWQRLAAAGLALPRPLGGS